MIVTVSTMRARAGAGGVLGEALRAVTPPTLEEPGCASYVVGRDIADQSTFLVVAAWASQDALEEHVALPHSAAFREATGDAFAEPFTTVVLEPVA